VAKGEVTSWVRAPVTRDADASETKPEGVERVLGELVTCPYCVSLCVSLWTASGLSYALVLYPRQTRVVATIFGAQAVADFLNAAFVKLKGD
jgi:hypothetical protein